MMSASVMELSRITTSGTYARQLRRVVQGRCLRRQIATRTAPSSCRRYPARPLNDTSISYRVGFLGRSKSTLPEGDVMYLPMPKLSPSMVDGKVTKWLKGEGDEVNEYDPIMELSTTTLYAEGEEPVEGAAVDMIVELAEAGYVGKLLVQEGETVKAGQAVMAMCEEKENVQSLQKASYPSVNVDSKDGEGLRVATFQGYLNGETPEK